MKASRFSEVDQLVESSAKEAPKDVLSETVETDFSVASEVVTDSSLKEANLQAGTSAATSCGPVLSIKCPKDILPEPVEAEIPVVSDVVTDPSLKEANVRAGTLDATSCNPVLSKNKEIVSSDGDSVTTSDGEEVITNSDDTRDQEGTCGIPEQQEGYDEQIKDHKIEPSGEIDFETGSRSLFFFFTSEEICPTVF